MDEGNSEDYAFLSALEDECVVALPNRLLAALTSLEGPLAGYQISQLEHSLQSATRAEVAWIIEHHGVFQMHFFGDAMRVNRNAGEIFREHA